MYTTTSSRSGYRPNIGEIVIYGSRWCGITTQIRDIYHAKGNRH
ncbi:hypothetical protein [Bradyrhizobium sp. WSM4349]|nr:hypothetical protein [Bradyrhizobium sp. WSM4349]